MGDTGEERELERVTSDQLSSVNETVVYSSLELDVVNAQMYVLCGRGDR